MMTATSFPPIPDNPSNASKKRLFEHAIGDDNDGDGVDDATVAMIDVVVDPRRRDDALAMSDNDGNEPNGSSCSSGNGIGRGNAVDVDIVMDVSSSSNRNSSGSINGYENGRKRGLQSPQKRLRTRTWYSMDGSDSTVRSSGNAIVHEPIRLMLWRRQFLVPLWSRRGIKYEERPHLTHVPSMRDRQYNLFAQMRQAFAMGRSHRRRVRMFRNRSLAMGSSQFHDQQLKLNGGMMRMGLDGTLKDMSGGSGGRIHYYQHHEADNNNNSTPFRDVLASRAQLFQPEDVDETIFDMALQFLHEKKRQQQKGTAAQM